MAKTFQSLDLYPELAPVQRAWRAIRSEALAAVPAMVSLRDPRAKPDTWSVLPMLPEAEDRSLISAELAASARQAAPLTTALVERVPGVRGFAFSRLTAGAGIKVHHHSNPFVTAALTLVSDGTAAIEVSGMRHAFVEGEFVIFDYRQPHSVINPGRMDRIVLLVLLDNRGGDD